MEFCFKMSAPVLRMDSRNARGKTGRHLLIKFVANMRVRDDSILDYLADENELTWTCSGDIKEIKVYRNEGIPHTKMYKE